MPITISQIRDKLATVLNPIYGEDEAGQMVRMLFEHFCGMTGASRALKKNDLLPQAQYEQLMDAMQELSVHIPIQYILGHAWFYNLSFEVNPSVLIPRPETEELADLIVTRSIRSGVIENFRLLDIGTGSGCLAVSLKKALPTWQVSACDISEDALQVARRNAELAETQITFFQADVLRWKHWTDTRPYHLIVSNPPYICEQEKTLMQANVLENEPKGALFVPDDDPLIFYRAIAEFAALRLVHDGNLYLEINEHFGPEMVNLLASFGFSDIELLKDFRGKDRFVVAGKV
jgi:release factor glutamine methyltransferase